ncbi:hypothetical protein ACFV3E_24765 [Streptomyces sp. NPDC059718]
MIAALATEPGQYGAAAVMASVAALVYVARTWPARRRARHAAFAPRAVVTTAFRYCPAELRTRAVVMHRDGTGRCDCGADIPAGGPDA